MSACSDLSGSTGSGDSSSRAPQAEQTAFAVLQLLRLHSALQGVTQHGKLKRQATLLVADANPVRDLCDHFRFRQVQTDWDSSILQMISAVAALPCVYRMPLGQTIGGLLPLAKAFLCCINT